jgi:hypothetical protein
VSDNAGANFLAEQALEHVFIQRQRILRKDGIAQLLELLHDFVIEARVVVIGSTQHHDADAIFALELV